MFNSYPIIVFNKDGLLYIYRYDVELQLINTIEGANILHACIINDQLFCIPMEIDHHLVVGYLKDDQLVLSSLLQGYLKDDIEIKMSVELVC